VDAGEISDPPDDHADATAGLVGRDEGKPLWNPDDARDVDHGAARGDIADNAIDGAKPVIEYDPPRPHDTDAALPPTIGLFVRINVRSFHEPPPRETRRPLHTTPKLLQLRSFLEAGFSKT
jgi:hypothetical protein